MYKTIYHSVEAPKLHKNIAASKRDILPLVQNGASNEKAKIHIGQQDLN